MKWLFMHFQFIEDIMVPTCIFPLIFVRICYRSKVQRESDYKSSVRYLPVHSQILRPLFSILIIKNSMIKHYPYLSFRPASIETDISNSYTSDLSYKYGTAFLADQFLTWYGGQQCIYEHVIGGTGSSYDLNGSAWDFFLLSSVKRF